MVNGSWKLVGAISSIVRRVQTGYIYHYALIMLLGVFVMLSYFVWFNK
jgi:NADH-quinone oxidoreductase subunit L